MAISGVILGYRYLHFTLSNVRAVPFIPMFCETKCKAREDHHLLLTFYVHFVSQNVRKMWCFYNVKTKCRLC